MNADALFLKLKATILDPEEDSKVIEALDALEIDYHVLQAENRKLRELLDHQIPEALAQIADLISNHMKEHPE